MGRADSLEQNSVKAFRAQQVVSFFPFSFFFPKSTETLAEKYVIQQKHIEIVEK